MGAHRQKIGEMNKSIQLKLSSSFPKENINPGLCKGCNRIYVKPLFAGAEQACLVQVDLNGALSCKRRHVGTDKQCPWKAVGQLAEKGWAQLIAGHL